MNKAHNTLSMLGLVAILALSACTDRTERSLKSSSPVTPPPSMAAPATAGADSLAPAQQMPASGSVALNPEHGQPGHRCEIPVGAPLNSAPTGSTPSVTINPSASSPAISAPATTTARLNPAHGEPGHDCAVPVGSPLPN